jgi:ribosome-associated protein
MVRITDDLTIPEDELGFDYARSSGPGGQNVNKVETKVTLRFDLRASASLNEEQKERIGEELGTRITKDGILRVTSQRHRTRKANQNATIERFAELLAAALEERAPRRPTRVPRKARQKRLEDKRRRSRTKQLRSRPPEE